MGDRYDRIRDNLPELLERYGRLRDPEDVKEALATWRRGRSRAASTPTRGRRRKELE